MSARQPRPPAPAPARASRARPRRQHRGAAGASQRDAPRSRRTPSAPPACLVCAQAGAAAAAADEEAAAAPEERPLDPVKDRGLGGYGCPHYRRRAKFVSPCCGEVFFCRHCHNAEKDESEPVRGLARARAAGCQSPG